MAARASESDQRGARKLRELFKGRFCQEDAFRLIDACGGLEEAASFLLTENEEVVHQLLKSSPTYLKSLREDSQKLGSLLENKVESTPRLYACPTCKKCWWKVVPIRKEVSKCFGCKVKYDPIPKDMEWGWGKFLCPCGNEFAGMAIMGDTLSQCYRCYSWVPVDHILAQRKKQGPRRSNKPHNCNGTNCYSHCGPGNNNVFAQVGGTRYNNISNNLSAHAGDYPGPRNEHTCIHPKSGKMKIPTYSKRHISSGSTVTTFLSQGSLDTQAVSVSTLDPIPE